MNRFGEKNKIILAENKQKKIIKMLLLSCHALKSDFELTGRKLPDDEGAITYYLIEEYLDNDDFRRKNKMEFINIRFIPEYPENYNKDKANYKGRLDMKVIGEDFLHDRNTYAVIECKRLDGESHLKREYVKEGIDRFVGMLQGEINYLRHTGMDMMLGYIVKDEDMDKVLADINDYLGKKYKSNCTKSITEKQKEDEWMLGDSMFQCVDGNERQMEHMFYKLHTIIESEKGIHNLENKNQKRG